MPETLFEHTIAGGAGFSVLVRAGRTLRLQAEGPDACASTLVLNAGPTPGDRLNVPDTLKAQMSARIRPPMVLMSDLGLGLASVVGSSLDWHDCLTGHGTEADLERYGRTSYADDRNDRHLSARRTLLSELRKHGRDECDLHGCVNVFAKVQTSSDDAGSLAFIPGHSAAADWFTLRAEVDLLVVLAATQHPWDPRETWDPAAVTVTVATGEPYGTDDPSWTFRDESRRALEASWRYLA